MTDTKPYTAFRQSEIQGKIIRGKVLLYLCARPVSAVIAYDT